MRRVDFGDCGPIAFDAEEEIPLDLSHGPSTPGLWTVAAASLRGRFGTVGLDDSGALLPEMTGTAT